MRLRKITSGFAWGEADMKLCECGCGQPTNIAPKNSKRRGQIKGQPMRFLPGHHIPKSNLRTATTKFCPGCQQVLPVAAFQRCTHNVYQARCRQCRLEGQRIDSDGHRERTRRYRGTNKEKYAAHSKVNWAVRRGELQPISKCTCSRCGAQARHYHHDSYDRPLDVTPVCSTCHKLIHMEQGS